MAVNIKIVGDKVESDEYIASLELKSMLSSTLPKNAEGEIVIHPNVTLYGTEVKDIDILLIASLTNLSCKLEFFDCYSNENISDIVDIYSFVTSIELKKHGASGVFRRGTDFYVRYGDTSHNVTEQSNKQKISIMNFLKKNMPIIPYVTNVIWFKNLLESEYRSIASRNGRMINTNCLCSEFSFSGLLQCLVKQSKVSYVDGKYSLNCNKGKTNQEILSVIDIFTGIKETIGDLTRSRIEQISLEKIKDKISIGESGKTTIYRGKAGTGKTVGLIQTAVSLYDELSCRVLLLTYNDALVSDIRRLFAFISLPDMFNPSSVCVNTMHSYFYNLINTLVYNGKLKSSAFLNEYDKYLIEFDELINDNEIIKEFKKIIKNKVELNWDYVLVDEAQDWKFEESSIITKLFDNEKIIVADGGQQFVRNISSYDWNMLSHKNNIKLKECLRQKSNLIDFNYHFSLYFSPHTLKTEHPKNMVGGNIVIVANKDKVLETIESEIINTQKVGNIPYDVLCLVPHDYVLKRFGDPECILTSKINSLGVKVWDGTNSVIRQTCAKNDEIRILQYESSRGLEGWTVVCVGFDTFMENKLKEYEDNHQVDLLSLQSPEEMKNKYLLNWLLIPLTRSINTTVITIDNSLSPIYSILQKLAEDYPDYITWVE